MKNFINKLVEMGISHNRSKALTDAINSLNGVLSTLDNKELEIFSQKYGVLGHLDEFARLTGDRNNAQIMHKMALKRAVRLIDFEDDFEGFSDKLYFLAEQAEEVKIPGAHMLCNSLATIRKAFETRKGFYGRIGRYAMNIAQVTGHTTYDLNLHVSGKYKDHYDYLNENESIGSCSTLLQHVVKKYDIEDESGVKTLIVRVDTDYVNTPHENIEKALKKCYTIDSCGHEHDCCGCRRHHVLSVKHLAELRETSIWAVRISWSTVN